MSDTADTYEPARRRWTGTIGHFQARERVWMVIAGAALLYAGAAQWQHSAQLASLKTEARDPRVLTANCDGTVSEAKLVPASEYQMADGLVFARLNDVVRCMRGMDGDAQATATCWKAIQPMFRGQAARRYELDAAALLGKPEEFRQRIASERVRIERLPGNRKTVEGGFGLSWHEVGQRKGRAVDESWSGVFTVQLSNVEDESGGMQIVDYVWEQDR